MASPTCNLSSVIKLLPDTDVKQSISTENSQHKPKGDISESMENSFQSLASPYNQVINDSTSPPPCADIPQWKKDLILRRKTNISKTLVANQIIPATANASKVTASTTTTLGVQTYDSKSSLTVASNNKCDNLTTRAQNANTVYDTKMNTSQHSFASALNLNNAFKTPAALQQQIETESYGGHYTQVNNKSSGGTHNYNEMLAARTASTIQPPVPLTRSFAIVEQNSNDGSPTSVQENVKFRKNMSEQHETTNTTSSDSLITSTSRLSSSLKVAAAAEIYKKSNKDHSSVCVSEHQQTHILQEPALATHESNNNGNGGGDDDEQQLHHQFKSEQESDNLLSSCTSVNLPSPKEIDSKLFVPNNNAIGSPYLSSKVVLNKKPCGTATASTSVRSSQALPTSQFVKNQNIGSSTSVSSHNHKINTKYRASQNSHSLLSVSAELPTATVTNNKKKMVAVQEMNEISNNELDFDPSEELQYGPGIVSKLRCRYLSLAMRQSMGKQRLSMDTLRRATSLNNLLDDNDVHDDDDDDDDILDSTNKEETSPTSVPMSEMRIEDNSVKLNETVAGFKKNLKNNSGERIAGTTHAYINQHRSRHIKRGNDSLKRARSVEALLCEKSPWNFSNNQPMILSNYETDSVTIEDKINNARDRLLLGTDNPPKRLTSIIDDTERPPPDLVKQTLKIFEASANRRSRFLSRSSGGEVATKVANYKSKITQNKPAITFPKPVSPKKSNLKKTSPEANITPSTPPATSANSLVQAANLVSLSSTPAASSRTGAAFRPKMDLTPIRSAECVSVIEGLSDNSPDIIPRHTLLDKTFPESKAVESPVTALTKKIEKLRIESPLKKQTHQPKRKELQSQFSTDSSDSDSEDDDSIDGEYIVNNGDSDSVKRLSKSPLENIAKAGTSQQFPTKSSAVLSNGSSVAKLSEALHDIPTLPITGTTTVKQIGIIRPLLVEPHYTDNISVAGCTDENTPIQAASSLTSREIEKNRINNEKKTEQLEMNSSMDDLGCVGFTKVNKNIASVASTSESVGTTHGPAWSSVIINKKKRTPVGSSPENNTMVFNFKDRKEVPDYIDNDIFIFNRKRELPKPNESGYVMLGDLSLETSTDPEDELPICPPSPCDVEFENANVLIDGKSSIKNRPKEAHFRVQFNDTLTSTFEYPSESSVIEDLGSEYVELSGNANISDISLPTSTVPMHISGNQSLKTDSPTIHYHVTVEEIIQLPHNNKDLGSLSLGSAPLGNYTPVKAKTENIFQLGITRVPNSQTDKSDDKVQAKEILPAEYYGELDDPSLEYLKPASDDLTIAYSEGSLKTDLLY